MIVSHFFLIPGSGHYYNGDKLSNHTVQQSLTLPAHYGTLHVQKEQESCCVTPFPLWKCVISVKPHLCQSIMNEVSDGRIRREHFVFLNLSLFGSLKGLKVPVLYDGDDSRINQCGLEIQRKGRISTFSPVSLV